ncbi:MAG: hypothetical protein ACE5JX_13860, partial [Acidobacteriota bacterium]
EVLNGNIASGDQDVYRNALTTLLGRYSQFSGRFTFGVDGTLLSAGTPTDREFATEEYEFYLEDTWQVSQDLTLNLGLRWGLNTVVNETSGFQVAPTQPLGDFFEQRLAGAEKGVPFNELITIDTSGPFYGKPGFYPLDKNNFMPRISAAWSPTFEGGFLKKLFGGNGESVLRGGFAVMYDRVGSALAVAFDLNNTLGFVSRQAIAANTFNVSSSPGPLFTGFDQAIRPLLEPNGLTVPTSLVFPLTTPADEAQRIERSLDSALTSPIQYSFNFSYGRELPGGLFLEASYIGRRARNLLANRDIMQLNNLRDPASGMDWFEAGRLLAGARFNQVPVSQMAPIPFFENLFGSIPNSGCWWCDPSLSATQNVYNFVAADGIDIPDYTFLQLVMDDFDIKNAFFHPQIAALNVLSSIAESDYDAFTLTLRERFQDSLTLDFNYTLSKSFDWASGGGTAGFGDSGGGYADILNAVHPEWSRGLSDFDVHHIINANWLWELPFGRGRALGSDMGAAADALLGGWSLNGIFRWNSGLAQDGPFESSRWATNWNAPSRALRIRDPQPSPNKGVNGRPPNFWTDQLFSYQSFRDAAPGEVGDRNPFRTPSFVTIDFGLHKAFTMPFNEDHRIVFRWEVFNATNTQRLGRWTGNRSSFGTAPAPNVGTPASSFGNITQTQGMPRVMQFGLRYEF